MAPVKLEDDTIHDNPPGISRALVEGRTDDKTMENLLNQLVDTE